MRRAISLLAIAASLALAACTTTPKDIDGNLVNAWALMSVAVQAQPKVGICLGNPTGDMLENTAVKCNVSHLTEILFVGLFTGATALAKMPPRSGSPANHAAYALCQAPAKQYLGGDWHDGLLDIGVLEPDADGWHGGARWFACTVNAVENVADPTSVFSSMSFANVLSTAGRFKLACVNWTFGKKAVADMVIGSCAKPHSGEFAGTFTITNPAYPSKTQYFSLSNRGCEAVVARYLGLSTSTDSNPTTGWVWVYNTKADWAAGNRTIRCYVSAWTHDHKFVGTARGLGNRVASG